MDENKKAEYTKGMFAGATFNNSVVVGVAEAGSIISYHKSRVDSLEEPTPQKVATKEMMSRAAKVTLDGGYWKSHRSWSVIFIVYSIWGYNGGVSNFVEEVPGWPDGVAQRMTCNRDAVEKLKNKYNFTKNITEWRGNGVPEQYCILGEQLDAELERMIMVSEEAE